MGVAPRTHGGFSPVAQSLMNEVGVAAADTGFLGNQYGLVLVVMDKSRSRSDLPPQLSTGPD